MKYAAEICDSGVTIPATRIPAGFLNILRTDDCFNFYTEPQTEAGGGRKYWPRGKIDTSFSYEIISIS